MRVALDTNILIYAEGIDGAGKRDTVLAALRPFGKGEVGVPVQVLGEFFAVLRRKARWEPEAARAATAAWAARAVPIPTTAATIAAAMEIVVAHRLASWDAVVLAAAAEGGCDTLFSEDMQHGFAWRGVTVRNPFRPG